MISVIIPFHNEEKNLPILIGKLRDEFRKMKKDYELVMVNDGSTDSSKKKVEEIISSGGGKNILLVNHRKRSGKGRALHSGLNKSSGEIIVFMDADLQDDPKDLPEFIGKIEGGLDFVNGIRQGRHKDNIILRTYSAAAEKILHIFLESPYTDINCGFKVFRRKVLKGFRFYGNNFRFFPLGVYYSGFKVGEIPVTNNLRQFGKSKFGPGKLVAGIFDMLTAFFIFKFSEQPLHFFGPIGFVLFAAGSLISLYLSYERIFYHTLLVQRPILWLAILLIIIGIQITMTGIIGELIVYLEKKRAEG